MCRTKMGTKPVYENLGKRIRDLRQDLGQTQDQMAKQMGISRASLANIEAGRQQVLVHHLFTFADALQLESPAQLLLSVDFSHKDSDAKSLPLPKKGLTKKQQNEVLIVFADNISNNNTKKRENKWTATKKTRFGKK